MKAIKELVVKKYFRHVLSKHQPFEILRWRKEPSGLPLRRKKKPKNLFEIDLGDERGEGGRG